MISKELEGTLNIALKEAKARRHEYVSLEHLLYSRCSRTRTVKRRSSLAAATSSGCKNRWRNFSSGQLETLPEGSVDQDPQQTLSFHRVLQRAVIHAQSAETQRN